MKKQEKTIGDDDWMVYLTLTTATKKISFFTFDWIPTKEATLLSWRQQSPKKRLTYKKCFIHPRNNYDIDPIFEVPTMFTRPINTDPNRGTSKIPASSKLLGHLT